MHNVHTVHIISRKLLSLSQIKFLPKNGFGKFVAEQCLDREENPVNVNVQPGSQADKTIAKDKTPGQKCHY